MPARAGTPMKRETISLVGDTDTFIRNLQARRIGLHILIGVYNEDVLD